MSIDPREELKRRAAEHAVGEIRDGMVLGLGSGSTVAFFLAALAERVAAGLSVVGIPSSRSTAAAARRRGIPLSDFTAHPRIDLTVDGADQIERGTLNLIKGLGGALLREKLVASASARMLVIADESKVVAQLDARTPLPVEIVRFGWPVTLARLAALGAAPTLRRRDERPVITDNDNYLADCRFDAILNPAALDEGIRALVGVVETGLFLGLASQAIIASRDGIEVLSPERAR